MKWEYHVEEISPATNPQELDQQLEELGFDGWEAVTSWAGPADPHVNQGECKVFMLFKKPKGRG